MGLHLRSGSLREATQPHTPSLLPQISTTPSTPETDFATPPLALILRPQAVKADDAHGALVTGHTQSKARFGHVTGV